MERPAFDLLSAENFGSLVIGFTISLLLSGVVITQGYTYFHLCANDRFFLKVLAGMILLLEVVHSFLITYMMYHYMITLRGFSPNGPSSYQSAASIIPGILVSALVQGFFAFRIYSLSGTLYTSMICWFLFLLRLGGGLTVSVELFLDVPMVPNAITVLTKFNWLLTLSFVIGAVGDVVIAASLCYYLKRLAPYEGLTTTYQLLNRLMLAIIQTGMVTSIASVAIVICFRITPYTFTWFTLYMISIKLYANSFFLSLNMRHGLRERFTPGNDISQLRFPVIATSDNPSEPNTILHLMKPNATLISA